VKPDLSLYLVIGTEFAPAGKLKDTIAKAARGGITAVQLREKYMPARQYVELAKSLKNMLRSRKIPLMINDRVDVALVSGADGVHLGQSDIDPLSARRILGKNAIIGLSVENESQARSALKLPLSYVSASPVFFTSSKNDAASPLGLEGFSRIRKIMKDTRLVAIGGINPSNARSVIAAGADGLCVVSYICLTTSPFQAAKNMEKCLAGNKNEAQKA